MISAFCKRKKRIDRLKKLRDDLAVKHGENHFVIKALNNRISNIKFFWWAGI